MNKPLKFVFIPSDIQVVSDGPVPVNYHKAETVGGRKVIITYSHASGSEFPLGSTTVGITATSKDGQQVFAQFIIRVAPPSTLQILTTSLPNIIQDGNYSQALQATGGVPPYSWTIINGLLPDNLTLSGNLISGQAVDDIQTYNFSIRVQDSLGSFKVQPISITIVPIPAGESNAYFNNLITLPQVFYQNSMRTQQLVESLRRGNPLDPLFYNYIFPNDSYPNAQDACKLTWPSNFDSTPQLRALVAQTSGKYLFIWDAWYGPEWRYQDQGGQILNTFQSQYAHKEFQLAFDVGGVGQGKIFFEIRNIYDQVPADPAYTSHVDIRGYFNGDVQSTDIVPGLPFPISDIAPLATGPSPNVRDFGAGSGTVVGGKILIKHSMWIRYIVEVELNVNVSEFTDWEAHYNTQVLAELDTVHKFTFWLLTEEDDARRICYLCPVRRKKEPIQPNLDGISKFWWEQNTSSHGAMAGEGVMYFKNFVILKNYPLPGVPETDTQIFQKPL